LDAVGWRDHQHREGLDASIAVDVIEGMEFRSQISTALRRLPHPPSSPPVRVPTGGKRPMPPGAMQMDANDRWRQRQSWPPPQLMAPAAVQRFRQPPSRPEAQALPREASRAAESSCLASAAAAAAAAGEADRADQFLLKVKQTLGHGNKHRLFMEVCVHCTHVHCMCMCMCMCAACALHVRCVCALCVHCTCTCACALQVMMGFHSKVLDTVEVMEHVSALLQGHWSLLRQFNEYLSMVENVVPVAADSSGRAGRLRLYAPACWRRAALWAREESPRRLLCPRGAALAPPLEPARRCRRLF